MMGSIGLPELLLILGILVFTLAPVAVIVLALIWLYRRIVGIHAAQEEIRDRLVAIEKNLGKTPRA
jgi:hypothetical protein